jgi:hypothetical protein
MSNMPHAGHSAVAHTDMNSAGMFLMRETSGTAFQPEAWPMPMLMTRTGDWHLMWMGQAFIVASGFYGREPDEARSNIDWGAINSWSTRLQLLPVEQLDGSGLVRAARGSRMVA